MASHRRLLPALLGGLLLAVPAHLPAQESTGTITGKVIDGTSDQPVTGVEIGVAGTPLRTVTRPDGTFQLRNVPVGPHRIRTARIGYSPQFKEVTIVAGGSLTVDFTLLPAAAILQEVVVTGYGTQRREAITGSVSTIDGDAANVGVVSNVTQMIQGRAAGVEIITNNGEPGAGAQIRIRGGTSISASNEPLYVIDGIPINNVATEANGIGIGGSPPLPRNPLNLLNPADIASITILKDASATAIYGSRAANGVILVETKKGSPGVSSIQYDGYVSTATPLRHLEVLNGDQYRAFVQQQVTAGNLTPDRLTSQGTANTNWEDAVTRRAVMHNHNLSFSGGTEATRYRASFNYANQEGVVLANGLERVQARLTGTHHAFNDKLRLTFNATTSRVNNHYLPYENTGGFEGGVFQNVAVFNPTHPIKVVDPTTGISSFYELGTGRQSVRNPVALAQQVSDFGKTTRNLGNVQGELDLAPGLTGQVNVGADHSEGIRSIYLPRSSPVGAEWNGRALQANRDNTSLTLQGLLTFRRQVARDHGLDVVGGYETSKYVTTGVSAESRNFLTDAFTFNNLSGGSVLVPPTSFRDESRFVSFFGRTNYNYKDRYFLTGVLRYDGSSRFGAGHKWALFPAVSASWNVIGEGFMRGGPFTDLRLRAGWGLQGNPGVPPYASLVLLGTTDGARYVFGETTVTGVVPTRNGNPDLKWEQTSQFNVAAEFGLIQNRLSGSVEYYVKNTKDLLLTTAVPQPALVADRLENIGKVRNRGFESSLDWLAISHRNLIARAGVVFSMERNRVVDLGGRPFITTGNVSGQGQSGQVSERIIPGQPLGTFFGPEFVGVGTSGADLGKQLFNHYQNGKVVGTTTSPGADDFVILGNANPDFTLGFHGQVNWKGADLSFLIRSEVGQEVFNNTALVYSTKGNVLQDKNFLASALTDPTGIREPAIYSSRWVEDGSFVRLQNVTIGYTLPVAFMKGGGRSARVYLSGDNLILRTGYSGLDPEVHAESGLASRGIDYLSYPRPRTVTVGVNLAF
ncbi:MAG TPA: TonB-dependent receptor [Gemmatimonadales bacterium]|jgi:iron complex outermembrane receptor protein|nr:TonB-dependent receptor [Gemmatimonadales bacterium]